MKATRAGRPRFHNRWAYMHKGPIQAAVLFKLMRVHTHQQSDRSLLSLGHRLTHSHYTKVVRTIGDTVQPFSNKSECQLWYKGLQVMFLQFKTDNQFSCFIWICKKNVYYLFPMENKLKVRHLTTATPAPSPVGSALSTAPLAKCLSLRMQNKHSYFSV